MALSASKDMAIQQLIDEVMEFSAASMRWCADASEDATRQISNILQHLTDEAARVASMSDEAVRAVEAIRAGISSAAEGTVATTLIAGLKKLMSDHKEVSTFIDPIVQALQFQDRVTQMMENMVRMIARWALERERIGKPGAAPLDLVAFGNSLLACTTMGDERDCVRRCIPGLEPETESAAVTMF